MSLSHLDVQIYANLMYIHIYHLSLYNTKKSIFRMTIYKLQLMQFASIGQCPLHFSSPAASVWAVLHRTIVVPERPIENLPKRNRAITYPTQPSKRFEKGSGSHHFPFMFVVEDSMSGRKAEGDMKNINKWGCFKCKNQELPNWTLLYRQKYWCQ